jgi:Flp pilus assembly protein TadD
MDLVSLGTWMKRNAGSRKAATQNNPVAWNNLGTLFLSKGEKEKAKECYRKAVELGFTMAEPLAK